MSLEMTAVEALPYSEYIPSCLKSVLFGIKYRTYLKEFDHVMKYVLQGQTVSNRSPRSISLVHEKVR
jgi:hypothetical protein